MAERGNSGIWVEISALRSLRLLRHASASQMRTRDGVNRASRAPDDRRRALIALVVSMLHASRAAGRALRALLMDG